MVGPRNHVRCRELEDTLRSLERQRQDAQNEIVSRIQNVGDLRGQVQVERNTLSSLEEGARKVGGSAARFGVSVVARDVQGAIRNALRLGDKVAEEITRQEVQLRDAEARLAAEESLLQAAKEKLHWTQDKIARNVDLQRQNNC